MSQFEAAIIIPHYNDVARLESCLKALLPQLGSQIEMVVVDNASTDSLAPLRAAFPDVRIVTELRKGAAEARNRGVAETTAEKLFFLDCDCIPAPDWVSTALAIAPQADVIGGSVTVFDETAPPRTGAQAFEAVFAFDNRSYVEQKGFSVTANLLTRRSVFAETGPFVHGLSEDLDWCRRAVARGHHLIYVDALRVGHPSRGDWAELRHKWLRLTQEEFNVDGNSAVSRLKWTCKALAMPISVLIHLPKIWRYPRVTTPQDRWRATQILVRLRLARMGWMLRQVWSGKT